MQRSARTCIASAAISLGLAAVPRPGLSQKSVETELTGGSSRAWVLHRFIRPPIAGDACTAGAIYTFATTHDVTISLCQQGHVVASHHAWSISESTTGTTLTISGMDDFVLTFRTLAQNRQIMRLRTTDAAPTQRKSDQEFSLDED